MEEHRDKSVDESNSDAAAPVQTAPAPEPVVTAQKNASLRHNKWFWVGIVVVVALLAGLTYYLVTTLTAPKAAEDDGLSEATQFASPKVLVQKVKPDMRGIVLDITSYTGLGGKTVDGVGVYGVPTYKVDGRKYANLPAESFGVGYESDSRQAEKNYTALDTFFKDNKFKLVSSGKNSDGPLMWLGKDVKYVSYATYESRNLLCMIWHVDASNYSTKGAHLASVGCGDKASYAKAAEGLDEYYVAYTKGESNPSKDIVLGAPLSGDSNTDGYKVAVVYMEDPSVLDVQFEGLFLKGPGEKDWTYFLGSQGWLDCTEFGTDDLKKAFSGFNCYDKVSDKIINVGNDFKAPDLK